MKVIFCDLCQNLIKPTDKRCYIGLIESKDGENRNIIINEAKELLLLMQSKQEEMKKEFDTIKVYEICSECKKIYDYIFQLRKDKIKALKEKANRILGNKGDKKNE